MKIAIITTSRADYGIYASLLDQCAADPEVSYGLVVSGTHLSAEHGMTVAAIIADGHPIWGRVESVPTQDDSASIAAITGLAMTRFAEVWSGLSDTLDVVVCLGDRYEMFAAVAATVPFNLPVAHLHGGETTLGAIDDKYRHAISALSTLHFTATEAYAERVRMSVGRRTGVFAVGAPSLDGFADLDLPSLPEMQVRFGIDFSVPTILVTIHPETVNLAANPNLASCVRAAFPLLTANYQIVITLPNADTEGAKLRQVMLELARKEERITAIESFGKMGYFAAMKYCAFLLGNTSSGLLEAPSFGKYAINVGSRQAGRARGGNVIDVDITAPALLEGVNAVELRGFNYDGGNPYVQTGRAAQQIKQQLKAWQEARTQAPAPDEGGAQQTH
ncbi:MAG: UDP-N-acetylglucosamine 2-epimerase [Bacteroidota bacterium]